MERKSDDIESILSSIRALVSTGSERDGARAGKHASVLLLGPDQRIAEPEGPFASVQSLDRGKDVASGTSSLVQAGDADSRRDLILDEITLREMIAEIVHQELASTLDDRLSRKLRSLVRRELRSILSDSEANT